MLLIQGSMFYKHKKENLLKSVFFRVSCDNCHASTKSLYHLTMSDASIRNFCSYKCVMLFQTQFAKAPIVLAEPLVLNSDHQQKTKTYSNKKKKGTLIISYYDKYYMIHNIFR